MKPIWLFDIEHEALRRIKEKNVKLMDGKIERLEK